MAGSKQYEWKTIVKYMAIVLATMVIGKVTGGIAIAIAVPILVFAAIARDKPVELLFWTLFMTYFALANRNIFANNGIVILTTRITLILMAGVLSMNLFSKNRKVARLVSPFWGIFAYIFWECVASAQGWQPIVSYLKLILFFVIFLALICCTNRVNRSSRMNAKLLRSACLGFICVMVFGSVLLRKSGLAQLQGEEALKAVLAGETVSLFTGMTCHSQVLGPFAALIGVFIFADFVFSIKKFDKLYVALLLCCPVLVYWTSSRTGMGTFMAGCGLVMFFAFRAKGLGNAWKQRLTSLAILGTVVAGLGVVAVPQIREGVMKYVVKYGGGTKKVTTEDVLASRQGKFDEMFAHIKEKPFQGHGFQVSEEMLHEKRSGFVEYLSAPVEKGTWIFAIVEEGGAIGMIFFTGWVIYLIFTLAKRHAYMGASVMFTFLVANMGEFSIFSMSYIGGFFWALVFAAVCFDVQRMKTAGMQVFWVPIEQVRAEEEELEGLDAWTRRQG